MRKSIASTRHLKHWWRTSSLISSRNSIQSERCWMAEVDGQNVGHIFLVKHPTEPSTAKLRLLLVEPSARGLKLGSALVQECVSFASSVGYKKITLWTQSILAAACHIYQKAGFRLVEEQAN